MKFYRRLKPFKAISFDLDDTLYNNKPVMVKAEAAFVDYLNDILPIEDTMPASFWYQFKSKTLKQNGELFHDVTAWRRAGLVMALQSLDINQALIKETVDDAMRYFLSVRSDFSLPETSLNLLQALKKQYPLVAITNGNVDVSAIGIDTYFDEVYVAGSGNLKKPLPDMFEQALSLLAIKPEELLHVGDCSNADILGAQLAGCQSVWLKHDNKPFKDAILPTIEIEKVEQLTQFC